MPELRALYGAARLPALNTCGFFYVDVDERESSVTFGFDTSQRPKQEWLAKPYNTLRFFVEFTGVSSLRIAGIAGVVAEAERSVWIVRGTSDRLDVAVVGGRREIAFSAVASAVTQVRVELQGGV